MQFKLKWGSYTHDLSEAGVRIRFEPIYSEGGQRIGNTHIWEIEGELQAASQANVSTAISSLIDAYASDGQDLILAFDDDTSSTHVLLNDDCFGGTRVVMGPEFPRYEGSEYVNRRSFKLVVEGDVLSLQTDLLLAYEEMLSFTGGGPLTVHIELDVGPPQKQQTRDQTTYRVTQSGSSVGLYTRYIPPPIWPDAEVIPRRRIDRKAPRRVGPAGAPEFRDYETTWSYEFESADELVGEPNLWPG